MGRFFFPNGNIYYKLIFKLFFSSRSGILRIISIMNDIDIAPAWGSPIGISSWPYTAPEHGWIIAGITRPANGNYQGFLQVNGSINICSYLSNINTSSGYGNTQVMVRKNDIINTAGSLSVNYAYFIRLPLNPIPDN